MIFKMTLKKMRTYLAKFPAYNALELKSYTTKIQMTSNRFQFTLIIMHLRKTLFSIEILVSKLLYCISFLLFMQTHFSHAERTFLISLTLLVVQNLSLYVLTIILQLITIISTLNNFRVTRLTLSISYLHMKENLKTGTKSTENLSSPIIYIKMSHIFFKQFLKNENKY